MLARNEVITNAHILDFPGLLHDPLEVLFDAGRRVAFILGVAIAVIAAVIDNFNVVFVQDVIVVVFCLCPAPS